MAPKLKPTADINLKSFFDNTNRGPYLCEECGHTSNTQFEASTHRMLDHEGTAFHLTQDDRWLCPFVMDPECPCKKTFPKMAQKQIRAHMKATHQGQKYPCPLTGEKTKDDKPCAHCFDHPEIQRWKRHVYSEHKLDRFPCPIGTDETCKKGFASPETRSQHLKFVHGNNEANHECQQCGEGFVEKKRLVAHLEYCGVEAKLECPRKEEFNCTSKFKTQKEVNQHLKNHDKTLEERRNVPCPGEKEYNCNEKFLNSTNAKKHHRNKHTHPVPCPRKGCEERFANKGEADRHALDAAHPDVELFRCPVPSCPKAQSGHYFTQGSIRPHWKVHVDEGEIPADKGYVSVTRNALGYVSPVPLGQEILKRQGPALIEREENEDNEEDEEVDENEHLDGQEFDEEDDLESGDHEFSQKRRQEIESRNNTKWVKSNYAHVWTRSLGLKCIGSSGAKKFSPSNACPKSVRIDFDTALVKTSVLNTSLRLDRRCIDCHIKYDETYRLERAKRLLTDEFSGRVHVGDLRKIRNTFEASVKEQWSPGKFEIVMPLLEEIEQGVRDPASVATLDLEWGRSTREVREVAVITVSTGEVLLNAVVVDSEKVCESATLSRSPKDVDKDRLQELKIFRPRRPIERMTIDEIADRLREVITPDTWLLPWHTGKDDLTLLRKLLDRRGRGDVLPPDTKCIPMVPIFHANLKMGLKNPKNFGHGVQNKPESQRKVCASLPVLFPIMFPGNKLIGLNHAALPDCRQTRLMLKSLIHLCKPVSERGNTWDPNVIAKSSQRSIKQFFRVVSATGKGDDGSNKRKRESAEADLVDDDPPSKRTRSSAKK